MLRAFRAARTTGAELETPSIPLLVLYGAWLKPTLKGAVYFLGIGIAVEIRRGLRGVGGVEGVGSRQKLSAMRKFI